MNCFVYQLLFYAMLNFYKSKLRSVTFLYTFPIHLIMYIRRKYFQCIWIKIDFVVWLIIYQIDHTHGDRTGFQTKMATARWWDRYNMIVTWWLHGYYKSANGEDRLRRVRRVTGSEFGIPERSNPLGSCICRIGRSEWRPLCETILSAPCKPQLWAPTSVNSDRVDRILRQGFENWSFEFDLFENTE